MQVLKFTLRGKSAFFKKPEVNTYYYFTYGNIHKVALLGMFGALLGYGGYAGMKKEDDFPEFYEKLSGLQISIVPEEGSKGYIPRKMQSFNNSAGYASQEQGGNLVVKQQWLENPRWDVYVSLDCEEAKKVTKAVLNNTAIYLPYLGTNDHPAILEDAVLLEMRRVEEKNVLYLDSLFPERDFQVDYDDDEDEIPYKYSEYLPIGLERGTNQYHMEKMIFTNAVAEEWKREVWSAEGKNIVFI